MPAFAVDQVVPFRDDVAQRAAAVAERDAAIHAAGALLLKLVVGEIEVDFVPVEDAEFHRDAAWAFRGRFL